MNASARTMWIEFAAATGTDATYDAFAFGGPDTPDLAQKLAMLVRDGPKRATCGLLAEYEEEGEALPEVGAYSVVLDAQGVAVCITRTTSVEIVRFGDVDEQFAYDEAEGDRTLASWREAHLSFFAGIGRPIDDDSPMVCERFEKVWPLPADRSA